MHVYTIELETIHKDLEIFDWLFDFDFKLLPLGEQLEKYCSVGLEAISQSFDPAAESSSIQNSVVSFFETQGKEPLPENGWDAIREGLESGCKSIAKLTSKELLTIHEKVKICFFLNWLFPGLRFRVST